VEIPIYQVDAFTSEPFKGNPAAVCLPDREQTDEWMQRVAAEMNLAETAFILPREDGFSLRWFTPAVEVPLCGHATLAAGHILIHSDAVRFSTKSGILTVTRHDDLLELNLPAAKLHEVEEPELCAAVGLSNRPVWIAPPGFNDSAILEVENEAEVLAVSPDFGKLKHIQRMAIVTARGNAQDIASRVFVPYAGIDEDPVTGSAHGALVPYWAERLGRESFTALQASARRGILHCRLEGDRVALGGNCFTVIVGTFQL